MASIAENLKLVRERIALAAERSGRSPADVALVAISKTVSAGAIREAYEAGQRVFGENYAQELEEKAHALKDLDIEWHFTGHLQSNKAKIVAPIVSCVETIDSLKLAESIDKKAARKIDALIEVNIGDEESKSGVSQETLPELIRDMRNFENLRLKGLMIIPPFDIEPEMARTYFRKLREIMARINDEELYTEPIAELSMGMSHDYEVAIEEEATIVRVGTAIFGKR